MTYPQQPHHGGTTGQHWGSPPGPGQPSYPAGQQWGPPSGEQYPSLGYYGQPSGQQPLQGAIPHQQGYGQPRGSWQPPRPTPPRRSSAGKVVGIVLGSIVGFVVLVGGCGAILSSGSSANTSASPAAADPATVPAVGGDAEVAPAESPVPSATPAFPGAEPGDLATDPGGTLTTSDGLALTVAGLSAGDDTFGDTLCTDVSYSNGGSDTVSYNSFDWSLITPNGQIVTVTFFGSSGVDSGLGAGDLLPGGTTSGEVCFEGSGSGQFVVLYDTPSFFSNDRLAWINNR